MAVLVVLTFVTTPKLAMIQTHLLVSIRHSRLFIIGLIVGIGCELFIFRFSAVVVCMVQYLKVSATSGLKFVTVMYIEEIFLK